MLVVWGLPINGALWPMELTVNWMLGLENSRRFGQAGGVSKIGGWMGGVEALTGETFYAWYKYEGISDVFLNVLKIPRQSVIMLQSYPFQGIGGSWGSEAGSYQAKSRSWIQQNSFEGNSPKKTNSALTPKFCTSQDFPDRRNAASKWCCHLPNCPTERRTCRKF